MTRGDWVKSKIYSKGYCCNKHNTITQFGVCPKCYDELETENAQLKAQLKNLTELTQSRLELPDGLYEGEEKD